LENNRPAIDLIRPRRNLDHPIWVAAPRPGGRPGGAGAPGRIRPPGLAWYRTAPVPALDQPCTSRGGRAGHGSSGRPAPGPVHDRGCLRAVRSASQRCPMIDLDLLDFLWRIAPRGPAGHSAASALRAGPSSCGPADLAPNCPSAHPRRDPELLLAFPGRRNRPC